MADTSGQIDLQGLDVDKLAKGFSDDENVFKQFLTVTPTSAREMRWYQKTAGFITGTTTTNTTEDPIANSAFGTLPPIAEQSWTRVTSYAKHYAVESPWLTYADIKDSDPDVLATNVRDLTRAVENQIDKRIYAVLSGSLYLSGSSLGTGWGDTTNGNPIMDLLSGATAIKQQGYDISNLKVLVHPNEYKNLLNYIITVKGSSIPSFASERVRDGVVLSVVGQGIVVSNNCTIGFPVQIVPQRVATWKSFTPITAITKDEPGVGVKIRVWEDGEILLTDPNAGHVILGANV